MISGTRLWKRIACTYVALLVLLDGAVRTVENVSWTENLWVPFHAPDMNVEIRAAKCHAAPCTQNQSGGKVAAEATPL